ncbi:SGNH/GDSL hydrolase family protein [Bradyrhizobium sediminis]|uniref:SGNH/GDSL hydrolase family protein n=1 Tax=Bradyrhizobium sediminis TaxID=2840469 RepID=A0A975RPY7_9BRAD|nr:SGNH/GDSL hydrolase family protein [Bradyrhizobium sediminis]QWG15106.1 SGNH/GDSL hydrolase family protein [Bradyrhizobium sediminis]
MNDLAKAGRPRKILRPAVVALAVTTATLAALESFLRIADFRELREGVNERSLSYRRVQHNSLGLRDIEFIRDSRTTIMFLGDSFVWGLDAEADQRFSDLLRKRIPGHNIVAAGVSGFGTDQEYLLLQRLWPKIQPAVVVLIFCTQNDRQDNSTNIRYEGYQKPYFVAAADG